MEAGIRYSAYHAEPDKVMRISGLDAVLWANGFAMAAILSAVLLWRSRWKQFPVFTAWMVYSALQTSLEFELFHHRLFRWYSRVYWFELLPDFCLQIGIALELARKVLRPKGIWIRDSKELLAVFGFGAAIVSAVLCCWIQPPASNLSPVWYLRADLFTSLELCALLTAIAYLAYRLGLAWPRHALSIEEGLTAWSAVMCVTTGFQTFVTNRYFTTMDHLRILAWLGGMLWITLEFLRRSPDAAGVPAPHRSGEASSNERQPPREIPRTISDLVVRLRQRPVAGNKSVPFLCASSVASEAER